MKKELQLICGGNLISKLAVKFDIKCNKVCVGTVLNGEHWP